MEKPVTKIGLDSRGKSGRGCAKALTREGLELGRQVFVPFKRKNP